jgi:hypothetical protein
VARTAALAVDPFLLITLQPKPTRKSHQHVLLSNESILQGPLLHAFPSNWDPVSTIFGSLVNPGLIGVDLADLKSIVGQRTGKIGVMQAEQDFLELEVANWVKHTLVKENKGNYLVFEQSHQEKYDIGLIHEIASILEKEKITQTETYFTMAKSKSIWRKYQITMVQAV